MWGSSLGLAFGTRSRSGQCICTVGAEHRQPLVHILRISLLYYKSRRGQEGAQFPMRGEWMLRAYLINASFNAQSSLR